MASATVTTTFETREFPIGTKPVASYRAALHNNMGTPIYTSPMDADGNAAFPAVVDGVYTLVAQALDADGNVTGSGAQTPFTVATPKPQLRVPVTVSATAGY